jgi:uncharacterized membrane protein HdeD (DUF308 family)
MHIFGVALAGAGVVAFVVAQFTEIEEAETWGIYLFCAGFAIIILALG